MDVRIANEVGGRQRMQDAAVRDDGIEAVRSAGGIEEYRLASNGLKVLFMEARAVPVALLMLTYGVGSRHESRGFNGASHMLEHLMFKGSARFNKQQGTSIFNLLQKSEYALVQARRRIRPRRSIHTPSCPCSAFARLRGNLNEI